MFTDFRRCRSASLPKEVRLPWRLKQHLTFRLGKNGLRTTHALWSGTHKPQIQCCKIPVSQPAFHQFGGVDQLFIAILENTT
jgi:hypothetical protein